MTSKPGTTATSTTRRTAALGLAAATMALLLAAPASAATMPLAANAQSSMNAQSSTNAQPTTNAAATSTLARRVPSTCPAPAAGSVSCLATFRRAGAAPAANGRTAPQDVPITGYTPSDLVAAYNVPAAPPSAQSPPTIAIIDAYDDPAVQTNLTTYRSHFNLSPCTVANGCFTELNENGATSPLPTETETSWTAETDLDVQMVSAICPSCHILLVEVNSPGDVFTGVSSAVAAGAQYISMSWGTRDWSGAPSYTDQFFAQRGIAYVAAAGDQGYQPNYPASSSDVTAVGGTTLTPASDSRGWSETVWNNDNGSATASGCSSFSPEPGWQASTVPSSVCPKRANNDVSIVADPQTGVAVYSGGWIIGGGTSAGAPMIAAMYALAGTPNTYNYPAAYPYYNSGQFNDVVSGDDTSSDQACSPVVLCTAGVGWDGPSGLGTPNGVEGFAADPPSTPVITNPGTVRSVVGDSAIVRVRAANTDTKAVLTYTADGLPPGTTQQRGGAITGIRTTAGTYPVTVTVTSSAGTSAQVKFSWVITQHTVLATSRPTIIGRVRLGATVHAGPMSWHADTVTGAAVTPTVTYQWLANGVPIPGAVHMRFHVPVRATYTGTFIRVELMASKPYYVGYQGTSARASVAP